DGGTRAGLNYGPAERSLHSVDVPVISVVDSGRNPAERRFRIAYKSDQQSGLLVEIKLHRRLPFTSAGNNVSFAIADLFRIFHSQFSKEPLDVKRQLKVRVDPGRIKVRATHIAERTAWHNRPTLNAVEHGDALSFWHMSDESLFVRTLIENLDADRLSLGRSGTLFYAAGNLCYGNCAAERLNVAVDELVGSRQAGGKLVRFNNRVRLRLLHFFTDNSGQDFRFGQTPMTGVAGQFPIAAEVVFVDGEHHSHHVARNLFRFLVIFVKMFRHMAIAAFHAQRCRDESHGCD